MYAYVSHTMENCIVIYYWLQAFNQQNYSLMKVSLSDYDLLAFVYYLVNWHISKSAWQVEDILTHVSVNKATQAEIRYSPLFKFTEKNRLKT